jgi:REP element-mobilizing transposase RayT
MKYNPKIHHRKSIRLEEFDYANPWWYYVTICSDNHRCIFGDIKNGKMILNNYGTIVKDEWLKTPSIRKNIDLDYYVIMPNHIHGIIIIERRGELNSPQGRGVKDLPLDKDINDLPTKKNKGRMQYAPTENKFKSPSQTLGSIIRGFKSAVTKQIRINGLINFKWQRNYYEHIIRNERDLYNIRRYIESNPLKWELD